MYCETTLELLKSRPNGGNAFQDCLGFGAELGLTPAGFVAIGFNAMQDITDDVGL